jgi:acetyl-CoA carboxylase alpha subunit
MLEAWIGANLAELDGLSPEALVEGRYKRFRKLGSFDEIQPQESEAATATG